MAVAVDGDVAELDAPRALREVEAGLAAPLGEVRHLRDALADRAERIARLLDDVGHEDRAPPRVGLRVPDGRVVAPDVRPEVRVRGDLLDVLARLGDRVA